MITKMSRLRILGPRDRLTEVLRAVQDLGVLHLAEPFARAPLEPAVLTPRLERQRHQLSRVLRDIESTLELLRPGPRLLATPSARPSIGDFARWARMAQRTRRTAEQLDLRQTELVEERALLRKYQHFFTAFRSMLDAAARWPNTTAYHILLKTREGEALTTLRSSLTGVVGEEFELYTQPLSPSETAVLILVPAKIAPKVEHLMADAGVEEIPVPRLYGTSLTSAIPRMLERLEEIPRDLATVGQHQSALVRSVVPELLRARDAIRDRLAELDAVVLAGVSPRAFALEGWLPTTARESFAKTLDARFGGEIAVSEAAREEWSAEEAPVVLRNPRLLRPFEALIRLFPLPQYGSIDPTPFVAVFFPAFFGVILGDVGYGLVLGVMALILRSRAKPESTLRSIAEIAGACALFTVAAGLLYGEYFGDLGRRFGLEPLAFDREEALVPFLMLAIALGSVHVVLGLILGVVAARGHPRKAIGRGISAMMVLLILAALLAVIGVLPRGFFHPTVIGILVAFPVLVVVEGLIAPIELLSTVGNILSYARIMALGIASVMLAVVANRMVGAMGSVAVGVLFALLFHLVNFAIGLFSPTIHALRLHYVEFFGKFYSPGGVRYEPFRHWTSPMQDRRA